MTDQTKTTLNPFADAVKIIERAKEIDPPAWRDQGGETYERRLASIHKALYEREVSDAEAE